MPTELYGYSKITVKRITWAANQARVLEAEHAIKIDDAAAIPAGTAVQFTDPELGLIFSGRVYEPQKKMTTGEGIVLRAADKYRMLQKTDARASCASTTPAYTPGTSKIRIREHESINDSIALVM